MHHRFTRLWLFAAAPLLICIPLGLCAEPVGKNDSPSKDIFIGQRIKKALIADEVFRDLNIGFTVEDGTVKLWGDLPDTALISRADQIVRGIKDVKNVVNECKCVKAENDLPRLVAEAVKQKENPKPVPESVSQDAVAGVPWFVAKKVTVKPEEPVLPRSILLGPPVTTTFKPAFPAPEDDLPEMLERIRRSDPRFAGTMLELKKGWVYITGTVAADADARALGEKLSDVPGVEQVIIKAERK